ncbi:MAG: cell wall hydrolase [Caulobacteraceae bacterium]
MLGLLALVLIVVVAGSIAVGSGAIRDVNGSQAWRSLLALVDRLAPRHASPAGTVQVPIKAMPNLEAPPILQLRALAPDDAAAWNASNPISTLPNPASPAFHLPVLDANDGARALDCLTAAAFYEAASESVQGQQAVAQVVLNRLRHPAYPKTVCAIVFQGVGVTKSCQFTFACDGSLARAPSAEGWIRARDVASRALGGYVEKSVGGATHYHTVWVAPYWSGELVKVALIGAHIFYRWDGGWSLPKDALAVYAGAEPDVVKLYGVGAAPFTQPRIQLAILEAPVPPPHTAPPAEVAVMERIAVAMVAAPVAPALPPLVLEPVAVDAEGPTAAIKEVRRNRQVPLPAGW